MKNFSEWLKSKNLNESPLFKGNDDRLTSDTARSVETIDSVRLYKFLQETGMRSNNMITSRDASEAAAYVAWRINNRRAEIENDLFDVHNQLGGPRCKAGTEFQGTKD